MRSLNLSTGVEVATIGNEGLVGLPVVLGVDRTPTQAFVQVSGTAWRMRSASLRAALERHAPLRHVLNRYTQALFTLLAQGAACNRVHSMRERCARWLLLTHDRVESDEFKLTQAFLAQMLGVRRATVNEVAQQLQGEGSIRYVRGVVSVLSRERLEQTSCECYLIIRSEFERLIEGKRTRSPVRGLLSKRAVAPPRHDNPDES
ncbi:MAG TPA: Crp/Fnr family transcriptional regulator [Polyangiaceae bacterium]|nr:Crp/Fnr family transcriptional regulator [Polyangiaceae bacterium]